MISIKHECIYIHIPKTGGSSIEHAFNEPERDHATWDEIYRKNKSKWKKYFKFSFVRNPWDRAVSTFFFMRQRGLPFEIKYTHRFPNFKTWLVENYHNRHDKNLNADKWNWYLRPQFKWLSDNQNNLIVDFVGKFEKFKEDFDIVKQNTNLKEALPHSNKSEHRHWRHYYDRETFNIIENLSAIDIEKFDYQETFKERKIFL